MKREQKVFAILMAASMAFIGISGTTTASAAPISFHQAQLGNYIDDDSTPTVQQPVDRVLSSGKKIIKKSSTSFKGKTTSKKTSKKTTKKTYKVVRKGTSNQKKIVKKAR